MKRLTEEEAVSIGQKEKKFQTICRDCIFSRILENDTSKQEEYCCIPGRLKAFEDNGAEIISVQDPDEESKSYKIINNRICNMMRTYMWQEIQAIKYQTAYIGEDKPRLIEIARGELKLKCSFAIYMGTSDGKRGFISDERMDSVAKTMKDIDSGEIPPEEIVVINNCGVKPHNFIMRLRNRIKALKINCKWRMEYILENEDTQAQAINKALGGVVKNSKAQYISIFFYGDRVPENYLSDIDKEINDNLSKFIALTPGKELNWSGLFFQKLAYELALGGKNMQNSDKDSIEFNFLETLQELTKAQECPELIRPLKSVVKSS